MAIVIPGFVDSDKVPGSVIETVYGRGKQSIGANPVLLVVTGNKLTSGTATADADITQVFSETDADTLYGAGSEIAMQCYAALQFPGVTLYGAPVAEATSSPVAASLTITVGGTWSTSGTILIRLAGKAIAVAVGSADTTSTVATNLSAAINGVPRLPMSSSPASAVVTVSVLSKGTRGNDYVCAKDLSSAPAGLTLALSGGSALTGGVTPFSAGAGADNVTTVLSLLTTQVWDYQAWAQNDATNAGLIKTQLESQAGPLLQHPGFAVFGKNRSTATSISFAQTTLNENLAAVAHLTNGETHPCQMAAQLAALFATTVGANPNTRYINTVMPTIAPQSQRADIAGRSTLAALLNAGVSPMTTVGSQVQLVDAIQTHCLNGASPDYRTYHVGDVFVPIRVSKEISNQWAIFSAANPYAGPDPSDGQKPAGEGTATPSLWVAEGTALLKQFETQNWLQDVDQNPMIAEWNTTSKRIMSAIPNVVRSQNIQGGHSIRQTASS
jgi:phage tail sheath gpL-like